MRPTFPRSSVLVLGPDSIQSLVPSTLVSQLESLLESHRLEDPFNLADQRRKKLEESITIDEDLMDLLGIGFHGKGLGLPGRDEADVGLPRFGLDQLQRALQRVAQIEVVPVHQRRTREIEQSLDR